LHLRAEKSVSNPQKFYIGIRTDRNLAFLKLWKKKLRAVGMLPEEDVRSMITPHAIKHLPDLVPATIAAEVPV
jgi:hypothetical protein